MRLDQPHLRLLRRVQTTCASTPEPVCPDVEKYNIKLWKTFTDAFNCLPIAAIIDEKVRRRLGDGSR